MRRIFWAGQRKKLKAVFINSFFSPFDGSSFLDRLKSAISGEDKEIFEVQFTSSNGVEKVGEICATPLMWDNNQRTIQCILRDITDHKVLEEKNTF